MCQTYHRLKNLFRSTRWYFWVMSLNWKLVLVCLEIVLIFMHDKCKFLPNLPLVRKLFWTHPTGPLGDVPKWKLVLVHLEIVLMSTQDRSTVCVELIIGSKIVLDTPNGTSR